MSKTLDLSIDFDFFVREALTWDWGHGEDTLFALCVWGIRYRYSNFDIYAETDPATWADIIPDERFFRALSHKGLDFGKTRARRVRRIGVAESHQEAFNFFRTFPPADYLVNIDAHHDLYTSTAAPLSCENWLAHLHQAHPSTHLIQVYPKWEHVDSQLPKAIVTPCALPSLQIIRNVPIWLTRWADFTVPTDVTLRHIFLCRSGGWVPPHLDETFYNFISVFQLLTDRPLIMLDQMLMRDDLVMSHEKHLTCVATACAQEAALRHKYQQLTATGE